MKTDQLYKLFRNSGGVTTDTRNIGPRQIFFALQGENFNGNKFAAEALAKGASWSVISDPAFESSGTILVDDTLADLQALATHYRRDLNIPVLAITGTNGKTTTKELVSAVIAKKFKVHRTTGNLNNHIGVPLTILSAPPDTQMLIIEMGANHIGEIRALCNIARPDYGIITNIGTAHIEGFGSFMGVVQAKTELYDYLFSNDGIALFNDQNPILTENVLRAGSQTVPFSKPAGKDLLVEENPSDLNLNVTVRYEGKNYNICTGLFGKYNTENVRAAIATGLFFEVAMEDIADAIENYRPSNNRSQVKITNRNTLICDAYNANPSSMKAAIDSFTHLKAASKTVILGDMLELGGKTMEEHLVIIEKIKVLNPAHAFFVGKTFSGIASGNEFLCFSNTGELAEYLSANPLKDQTILIKGSRGIGLEKVYDLL